MGSLWEAGEEGAGGGISKGVGATTKKHLQQCAIFCNRISAEAGTTKEEGTRNVWYVREVGSFTPFPLPHTSQCRETSAVKFLV